MNPNFVVSTEPWRESIRWKQHELDLITDNYEKMSDKEIQKKLIPYRTDSAIREKRQQIGCHYKMQKHQIWTPEEVDVLLKVWEEYDQRQISERFIPTKTPIQVNAKKQLMGLNKIPVWSDREREILFRYGASYTSAQLQKMFFNNKTNNQIAWMRKHLGIFRGKK